MMNYRHTVFTESQAYESLAVLAAAAGAELAGLPYTPRVHFFREDPAGRYARPVRVAGFVDYRTSDANLDIFCRGGRSPAKVVETVFHESQHIGQYVHGQMRGTLTSEEIEARAYQFECMAPVCVTYEQVFGELAQKMTKWCVHTGDLERARKYHVELKSVDPEAAARLDDAVMAPEERRLRLKLTAEKERRMAEIEAFAHIRRDETLHWREDIDKNYGGSRW